MVTPKKILIQDLELADEEIRRLRKENKNLNEKLKRKEWIIANLRDDIQTLELWLDNKEKLNEEYRVKLDKYKKYYDRDKEELMESCYWLAKENKELIENEKYRYSRCMKAERKIQHSLGWDDELIYEEWLYD